MKIKISSKFSQSIQKLISEWVNFVQNKVSNLELNEDLTLAIKPIELEKDFAALNGITGYCPSAKLIRIGLDFSYPKLNQEIFALTLVHELHHAHQEYQRPKTSQANLKETMIEEGLADRYCEQILGKRPVWSIDLNKSEIERILALAKQDFDKPTTDGLYDRWFLYSSPKDNIPRWAGYALGYHLSNGHSQT